MNNDDLEIASTMTALGQTRLSAPPRPGEVAAPPALSAVRFERVGPLGRGGMGVVECVWDGDLMRELAVKRVRPELRTDARVVAMFLTRRCPRGGRSLAGCARSTRCASRSPSRTAAVCSTGTSSTRTSCSVKRAR
jgi:hypothetical protein